MFLRSSLVALFATFISGCATVQRIDYAVTSQDIEQCVRTNVLSGPKVYPPPELYDPEEISNLYLLYGVASLNAYSYKATDGRIFESDGEYSNFTVRAYDSSWEKQPRSIKPGGLALDYYFNDQDPNVFRVMIAFRGTEFTSVGDWYSNLSWLTQLLPFKNQYDYARDAVVEIRSRANILRGKKKLSIITTGHSLGGGLAEHIAHAFPCTSAVVFDSSFVVNRFRLAEPFEDTQVVHIFDKNDELTFVRKLFLLDTKSATYKRYGINPVAQGTLQHSSERLIVGMAGTVAMCQAKPYNAPGCPKSDARARHLYCGSKYAHKEQHESQCKV